MTSDWDDIMTAIDNVEAEGIVTQSRKVDEITKAVNDGLIVTLACDNGNIFATVEGRYPENDVDIVGRDGDNAVDVAWAAVQAYQMSLAVRQA